MKNEIVRRLIPSWILLVQFAVPFVALATPRQPLPPLPEWTLGRWHFDDALRQYPFNAAPAAIPEESLVESWSGYALQRAGARGVPFVVPELSDANRLNFTTDTGAIRFWFKPAWGSPAAGERGPGNYARLLEMVSLGNDRTTPAVQWSLYATPDGSALYVSGQGRARPRDYLRADLQWSADTWHLVLLAYTPTNSALYLDGELVTTGDGLPFPTAPAAPTLALVLGSEVAGTGPAQGDFDELTTFARLPSEWDLAWYYPAHARRAAQGPVSEAELLALQAWREALAKQRAERTAAQLGGGTTMLRLVGSTSSCLTNVPVFMTNIASPNHGWTVTFDVQGGTNGHLYDIFTTTALVGNNVTNAQWAWLEQGPTCSTYQYTNQPGAGSFYILGTPKDSDGDGLTDAVELLVTKSNPGLSNTDGDDLDDYWEWRLGRNPKIPSTMPDTTGLTGFEVFTPLH